MQKHPFWLCVKDAVCSRKEHRIILLFSLFFKKAPAFVAPLRKQCKTKRKIRFWSWNGMYRRSFPFQYTTCQKVCSFDWFIEYFLSVVTISSTDVAYLTFIYHPPPSKCYNGFPPSIWPLFFESITKFIHIYLHLESNTMIFQKKKKNRLVAKNRNTVILCPAQKNHP